MVGFIEGGDSTTTLDDRIPIDVRPDVGIAYDALYDSGHSGTYDLGRILNTIKIVPDSTSKMPGLYVGVMEAVQNYIHTADADLLDRFQLAFDGALRGRMSAASDTIISEGKAAVPDLDPKIINVAIYKGSNTRIDVLNPGATKNAIGDSASKEAFESVLAANKKNTHSLIAKNGREAAAKFVGVRNSFC